MNQMVAGLPEPGSVVVDDDVLGRVAAVLSRAEPVEVSAAGLIDTIRVVEGVKDAAAGA